MARLTQNLHLAASPTFSDMDFSSRYFIFEEEQIEADIAEELHTTRKSSQLKIPAVEATPARSPFTER